MSKVEVKVNLSLIQKDISEPLNSNKFGLFLAQEWKRLISPFTPRRTGTLEDTAIVKPWKIEYIQPYASVVYNGTNFNFRRDANPYATYEWDNAAINAGQDDKLIRAAQKYIDEEKL